MKKAFRNILVITDNLFLYGKFREIIKQAGINDASFTYCYSMSNADFRDRFAGDKDFMPIDVNTHLDKIVDSFDLVISAHSKQIFPAKMTKEMRCVNIHPGYNPHNRGWYPQVFSILNGKPLGATIHEIDEQVDHGDIIDQARVPLHGWDTSLSAYNRVLEAEVELVKKNIVDIVNNTYATRKPEEEGNVNMKKDFNALRELDLDEQGRFGGFVDRMRAMTHGDFKNAYFTDKESGKKIFVSINLTPEE